MCAKDFSRLMKWEITYEEREIKPFWESRLLEQNGDFKSFDEIHIKNGYQSNAPLAIYEFWGIAEGEKTFKIILGKLKSVVNYED